MSPLWLDPLAEQLRPVAGESAEAVTADQLLHGGSFPHLNCTVLRREHFEAIGGMDEGIRYECEVDLYLRTIDRAGALLFSARRMARHNVPAGADRGSESTRITGLARRSSQLNVYGKNLLGARNPAVRDTCRRRLGSLYRDCARGLHADGERQKARACAKLGQAAWPTLRWGLYSAWLGLRARMD